MRMALLVLLAVAAAAAGLLAGEAIAAPVIVVTGAQPDTFGVIAEAREITRRAAEGTAP